LINLLEREGIMTKTDLLDGIKRFKDSQKMIRLI